ncbi:helix-loop-helix DNA-binding domain-containing protein [Pseudomassariella vexata]|uniref:Helix-loop-helix DNA-binding domain-containing protein n=1 Tax=Pseudomassariella vexata TaxID=1141098 RepID=A0A1Y2DQ01_9PEZI|nr:helix-loop-helix DNA-binding domain-containing protein [Pseudomassariella vexata]ORY61330.1 helix-loop-helix DNA-binding domain-containing protein [Pseudomassariella vexata]
MPSHLQYHSPKSEPSPESVGSGRKSASISSPEGHSESSKANCRKRKSSADDDDDDLDDLDGLQPVKKTAHNMIEKRYRTNLNDKIAALRDSVPSLRIMSKSARGEDTTGDREELHGLTPAHKLNKATVLSKATEYIRHLEKRNNRLMDENNTMQARIAAFEKLFMAGAMNGGVSPIQQQSPTPVQYPQDANRYVNSPMSTPTRTDAQGMIQVPKDMKRIIAAQLATGQPYPVPQQPFRANPALLRQQQIQQQQQQAQGRNWQNAGPYFGKIMVGSLAALMILEGVQENEQSNQSPEGRGLFAVPVHFLRRFMSSFNVDLMGYHIAGAELIFSLKIVMLLCGFCWVIYPYLFKRDSANPKASKQVQPSLAAAPSLASPIHVRRQAWLTAVQTVWVPRHNFFLEAAALGLKALKLSLRNLTGVDGYQMLTGLTEVQEVARVKAWTIALDAQLAGGDVEISKSRLTLTLLASGTLPDTPLRLMLKALHIRVLLWEVGLSGMNLGVFNTMAMKMARVKWNEAKQLHRLLTQLRRGGHEQSDDNLPDHLAVLLEQDADDVLNPSIIQRAHNLAWNRPTRHNAIGVTDGMDMVVDDTAVRSPMDAVAAWWSSMTLQTALQDSLLRDDEDGEIRQLVEDGVTLAIRTAPIGSVAQNRALVARAVLFNEKRGANIAAVIQAIGPLPASAATGDSATVSEPTPPSTPHINIPASILTEAEIYMCLQCAKAIAHLQRYSPPDEPTSVYPIIDEEIHVSNEMSLLGYTAAFTLMERLAGHEFAAEACSGALERLSGGLRIWTGKDSWLEPEVKQEMVERCLAVTRGVVGMDVETDTGYGSMSGSEEFRDEIVDASDASDVANDSPCMECRTSVEAN